MIGGGGWEIGKKYVFTDLGMVPYQEPCSCRQIHYSEPAYFGPLAISTLSSRLSEVERELADLEKWASGDSA